MRRCPSLLASGGLAPVLLPAAGAGVGGAGALLGLARLGALLSKMSTAIVVPTVAAATLTVAGTVAVPPLQDLCRQQAPASRESVPHLAASVARRAVAGNSAVCRTYHAAGVIAAGRFGTACFSPAATACVGCSASATALTADAAPGQDATLPRPVAPQPRRCPRSRYCRKCRQRPSR